MIVIEDGTGGTSIFEVSDSKRWLYDARVSDRSRPVVDYSRETLKALPAIEGFYLMIASGHLISQTGELQAVACKRTRLKRVLADV